MGAARTSTLDMSVYPIRLEENGGFAALPPLSGDCLWPSKFAGQDWPNVQPTHSKVARLAVLLA